MLSYTQFSEFVRALRQEPVLTVYLSGVCRDPSAKEAWRIQLDHAIHAAQDQLGDVTRDERQRFERCVQLLMSELAAAPSVHATPGLVAFVTADGVRRMESLPIDVPTVAVWGTGPFVAPYLRAMQQDHRGVIAVADAREVALYRYREDAIASERIVRAELHLRRPLHMGDAPRQGFHPGVRGETGREATQRIRAAATERMLRDATDQMLESVGAEGWILVGGIPGVASHLVRQFPRTMQDRVLQLDSLDVHASEAMILDAARRGIAAIRDAADVKQVQQLVATGGHDQRVALGGAAVQQALAQSCVRTIYISDRYIESHAEDAESTLNLAMDQRALVHVLAGQAADTLDDNGGIAAQLRYGAAGAEQPPMTDADAVPATG